MNVGNHIISSILATGEVQPYLDAGLTLEWLSSKEDYSPVVIFADEDENAYRSIIGWHAKFGKVPSTETFRKSFPADSYRLHAKPETAAELIALAQVDIQRVRVEQFAMKLVEFHDAGNYAGAIELVNKGLTSAGQLAEQVGLELLSIDDLDDSAAAYRVEKMMPWQGTVMLSAAAKSGKSTLAWNLIRSIVTKEPFLGHQTDYDGRRIAYVAAEMEQGDIKAYARDAGIPEDSDVKVIPIKGRVGSFNITDDAVRAGIAKQLDGVEILILDPLGPVLAGLGLDENSNRDVSLFREACEKLIEQAGIDLLLIVHHTGHGDKGRSRGASALMDWPDALWTYETTSKDEEDAPRRLRCVGRKIGATMMVTETSPQSGRICLATEETTLDILQRVWAKTAPGETSVRDLFDQAKAEGYKPNRGMFGQELKSLTEAGRIMSDKGPRGKITYQPVREEF